MLTFLKITESSYVFHVHELSSGIMHILYIQSPLGKLGLTYNLQVRVGQFF